jgi:hypothetical protein
VRRPRFVVFATVVALGLSLSGSLTTAAAAAGSDRPDTRSDARHAGVSPAGKWLHEALSSDGDQDWFRFHAKTAGRVLVTLGHLPGNYSLDVRNDGGKTVASSDRSGRQFEEVYFPVTVGDYFVKVAAASGVNPAVDYLLRFRPLPHRVLIVEQKDLGDIDGFDVVGELLNNTSHWMQLFDLHVTWLDKDGKALGTVDEGIRPGPIPPRQRTDFSIRYKREPTGDVPADATSYRIRVDAGTTKDRTPNGLVMTPTSNGVSGPQHSRVYEGTVTNETGRAVKEIYPTVIEYDGRGRANAIAYDLVHSLDPGESTSYKMFAGNKSTPPPNSFRLYATITGT